MFSLPKLSLGFGQPTTPVTSQTAAAPVMRTGPLAALLGTKPLQTQAVGLFDALRGAVLSGGQKFGAFGSSIGHGAHDLLQSTKQGAHELLTSSGSKLESVLAPFKEVLRNSPMR